MLWTGRSLLITIIHFVELAVNVDPNAS